jgi:hypothetical protein
MSQALAPEVDFESHDEYLRLEALFYTVVQEFVRSRVSADLQYWQRWPHFVNLALGDVGVAFLARLTKGGGRGWADAVLEEIGEILQEVATGVLVFSRLRSKAVTQGEMNIVLGDAVDRAVSARVRPLLVRNFVLVSPPRDAFGSGSGALHSWPQIFALRLAVATGGHARLGAASPLLDLEPALLRLIGVAAFAPRWPYFEP